MIPILVVIPAYNEAARLPALLADIEAYLRSPRPRADGFDVEFTIVDDGSRPEEFAAAETLVGRCAAAGAIRLMRLERNQGKGAAIRTGFEEGLSRPFRYLGFMDADGSVSTSELHDALVYLAARHGELAGVIGSRVRMLGRTVQRSALRHAVGRVFATFVAVYFGSPVYDTQCGLKVFDASVLRRYLHVPCDERWVWDTELLIAMLAAGEQIHEVPINWRETGHSKVSLFRDPLRMLVGLAGFKRRLKACPPLPPGRV